MKLRITSQLIIRCLFLFSICICIFNILELQIIISLLYALMFPIVIGLTIIVLFTTYYRKIDLLIVVSISALALLNSMIDILLAGNGYSLFDLKKTFIFIMTIVFLFIVNQVQVDKKTIKFVEKAVVLSSILIVALYFLKYDEIYLQTNVGVKFLYFNFSNPNFASMYLLIHGIYNLIFAWKFEKIAYKIICFCLAVFMFFAVLKTLSRNTLIIIIFYLVIYCLIRFKKKLSLTYSRIISFVVSVWPLIFAFFYMSFIHLSEKIAFLSIFDLEKGFDTRIEVWSNTLEALYKSPVFGDFSFTIIRQSHNSHLDIWLSYGFVVLFLTCLFIFLIVYNGGKKYKNRIAYLYMFGFICCIFIGMAEAALFSGCQGFFVMVGMLVLISKSENT